VHSGILFPHVWFATLGERHHAAFQTVLVGSSDPAAYWRSLRGWPGFPDALNQPGVDTSKVIPLAIHGDGVPVSGSGHAWAGGSLVLSVSSMLTKGPTSTFHHALAMFWESTFVKGQGFFFWRCVILVHGHSVSEQHESALADNMNQHFQTACVRGMCARVSGLTCVRGMRACSEVNIVALSGENSRRDVARVSLELPLAVQGGMAQTGLGQELRVRKRTQSQPAC
jgi:hypothetical protein